MARAVDPPETPAALVERAKSYAATVPIDVDPEEIRWEVSHRAKRRSGACLYDEATEEVTIRLTWEAYEAFGWERFTATIRHELIHALEYRLRGTSDHGSFFQEWARELDVNRRCEQFAEPAYLVVCTDCGAEIRRYRRSKLVDHPERYHCAGCGGAFAVEDRT